MQLKTMSGLVPMLIEKVDKKVMPETNEVRLYFSGYITPELIQNLIAGGGGYGPTHKEFVKDICIQILKREIDHG